MDTKRKEEMFLEILHELARLNLGNTLRVVTQGEFFLLSIIRRFGDYVENRTDSVNVSRLAGALEVTSASVSRTLSGLARRGYLERVTDPNNRRNTYVKLTEKGRSLFLMENELVEGLAGRVFDRMGEENMRTLRELSSQLHGILEEELEPFARPAVPEGASPQPIPSIECRDSKKRIPV